MSRSTNRSTKDRNSRELSLEEVLKSHEQPIDEEQAWAVCYQCSSRLRVPHPLTGTVSQVKDPSSILLHRDGTVSLQQEPRGDNDDDDDDDDDSNDRPPPFPAAEHELVRSLGIAIYRALDWGLDDSVERELSPQLECLIERMALGKPSRESHGTAGNGTSDEGYSGQEEEAQEGAIRLVCTFHQVMEMCVSRLANPSLAPEHYQAICRALFLKTLDLQAFLFKIRDAKELLKKITTEEALEDWSTAKLDARVPLMKEIRQGVKLKKVQEQPFNPLPAEFWEEGKVMVDGDIPTAGKRNTHELILDFMRSRPCLKPVMERSLPPPPPQQQSLHDRFLAEIKQGRKLRPVVLPSYPNETTEASDMASSSRDGDEHHWMEEFSHPVESLAPTVDEVINMRRVLVKAEMEKFLQSKELHNNLQRGKVCYCCRVKFPLFSQSSTCLLCKRSVCVSCSARMTIPSKKKAHIPVYSVGFHSTPKSHGHKSQVCKSLHNLSHSLVEKEFPHLYAHGCTLHDVCAECAKFVADVNSSSRRSLDILNNTPRKAKATARPQLQHQSQHDICSQPRPQCHPPPYPQSQCHPQLLMDNAMEVSSSELRQELTVQQLRDKITVQMMVPEDLQNEIFTLNVMLDNERANCEKEHNWAVQLSRELEQTKEQLARQKSLKQMCINREKKTRKELEWLQRFIDTEILRTAKITARVRKNMLQKRKELMRTTRSSMWQI